VPRCRYQGEVAHNTPATFISLSDSSMSMVMRRPCTSGDPDAVSSAPYSGLSLRDARSGICVDDRLQRKRMIRLSDRQATGFSLLFTTTNTEYKLLTATCRFPPSRRTRQVSMYVRYWEMSNGSSQKHYKPDSRRQRMAGVWRGACAGPGRRGPRAAAATLQRACEGLATHLMRLYNTRTCIAFF
jgi:hypothetical protein